MRAFILKCASPEGRKLGCLEGMCHVCRGHALKVNLVACALKNMGEHAIVDDVNNLLFVSPNLSIETGTFIENGLGLFPEIMKVAIFNGICESLAKLNNLDSYTPNERRIINDIIYFLWFETDPTKLMTSVLDEKFTNSEMGDFWEVIKDDNRRALIRNKRHQRLKEVQKRLAPERRAEKKRIASERHELRKLESIKRKPLYKAFNHVKKAEFLLNKIQEVQ